MEGFSAELFASTLAVIGIVVIVAALLSGLIERIALPQIAVLLGIGAAIGPLGLGMVDVSLESPILRIVATLSLALVLFTDALSLDIGEVRRSASLAGLILGPATLLTVILIALSGWWLLGLAPIAAVIVGAALASTDPIMLRGMLRGADLSSGARLALRLEGGMNDVLLLPIVIIAMTLLLPGLERTAEEWARLTLDLFVLGPGAGVVVGLVSVSVLDMVRRRVGVRRDYESLYALGVAFTAFAAAESVHGSGFLAAFTAGLTISALDVEMCDCFLEYGETTAEMLLLFTFVLLGSGLIWSGLGVLSLPALLFAVLALFGRLPIMLLGLAGTGMSWRSRLQIGWFGPRGLGSLLLVLLPVFAGLPGIEPLFAICSLVVLFSVVLHGFTPLFRAKRARAARSQTPPPSPTVEPLVPATLAVPANNPPDALVEVSASASHDRISIDEVLQLREAGEPLVVLDVRTERSYAASELQAAGALRLVPEQVVPQVQALGIEPQRWMVLYCT